MSFWSYGFYIATTSLVDPRKPGSEPITHRLLVTGSDLQLAVQFELGSVSLPRRAAPALKAGFSCLIVAPTGEFQLPTVISATDIDLGQGWELRTSGLWAEQTCERPFRHWSYGLEAFALAIDRHDELLRRGHGHRVPLGWELDFVSDNDPEEIEGGVLQLGSVEGIVLSAEGETSVEGRALRAFWFGSPPTHSDLSLLTHTRQRRSKPSGRQEPHAILPTLSGPWVVAGDLSA